MGGSRPLFCLNGRELKLVNHTCHELSSTAEELEQVEYHSVRKQSAGDAKLFRKEESGVPPIKDVESLVVRRGNSESELGWLQGMIPK